LKKSQFLFQIREFLKPKGLVGGIAHLGTIAAETTFHLRENKENSQSGVPTVRLGLRTDRFGACVGGPRDCRDDIRVRIVLSASLSLYFEFSSERRINAEKPIRLRIVKGFKRDREQILRDMKAKM
jgi:predicted TIM-barrel enzyme